MVLNVYTLYFLAIFLLTLVGIYMAWIRRHALGAKELMLLLGSAAYWCLMVFVETASTTLESKILLSKIAYPAVVSTPVLYLIFVNRFVGRRDLTGFRKIAPLFVMPVLTLALTWTNECHHLIWEGFTPINPVTNLIRYIHGIGFKVFYLAYSYVIMIWATFLLGHFIIKQQKLFRSQGWIILLASISPWVASIFYLLNINIAEGFDLTPGAISIAGLIFIIAMLKVCLLDLVPIAREALVENINEGILVLDDKDRVQDINKTAKSCLQVVDNSVLGSDIRQIVLLNDVLLNSILTEDSETLVECQGAGDAPEFYRISKIYLNTRPQSRLIVIRDVTELLEKQKAIQNSEEEYRKLYDLFRLMADNMPDMLWAKDLEKNYIFANKALCKLFLNAESTEEPIGKNTEFFLRRERLKKPGNPEWYNIGSNTSYTDDYILQSGQPGIFEEFGNLEGEYFHMDVRKAPIYDRHGKMIGIVGSSRDVTRQKKAEAELIKAKEHAEESDRLKSAFLSNMSHEIRTPMNSIMGFITLMQEPDITEYERLEFIKAVRAGGERLMNTLNDIIEISRIDSGEVVLSNSDVDVRELITLLVAIYSRETREKGLQLDSPSLETDPAPVLMYCDRTKLQTILTNLMKNAIKYTGKGGIEVRYILKDERIRFYVKDTGIGIPEEKQRSIFERFVQVDGSSTRHFEGTGLGLALTKAYVEMMGGSISVESDGISGSTFVVDLPLSAPKYEKTNAASAKENAGTGLRILIVEDDQGSVDYLNLILSRAGHKVVHTYTGFEALERCRQRPRFDMILMDIKLPGIDGYETTRRIRDLGISTPIIALSAFSYPEDRDRAMEAGCNDYLLKPISKEVLFERLTKYCR